MKDGDTIIAEGQTDALYRAARKQGAIEFADRAEQFMIDRYTGIVDRYHIMKGFNQLRAEIEGGGEVMELEDYEVAPLVLFAETAKIRNSVKGVSVTLEGVSPTILAAALAAHDDDFIDVLFKRVKDRQKAA